MDARITITPKASIRMFNRRSDGIRGAMDIGRIESGIFYPGVILYITKFWRLSRYTFDYKKGKYTENPITLERRLMCISSVDKPTIFEERVTRNYDEYNDYIQFGCKLLHAAAIEDAIKQYEKIMPKGWQRFYEFIDFFKW